MAAAPFPDTSHPPGAPAAETPCTNTAILAITTGYPNCQAHFNPANYHLDLVRDGLEEKVDLGFSGSRLLARLAQNPGEVVTREELMSYAWPGRVVGQGSLNQQIYTLRQILGDEKNRTIILTLPRRGYQINPNSLSLVSQSSAAVETIAAETPVSEPGSVAPSITDQPAPSPLQQPQHLPQRRSVLPTAFLTLGVIAACLLAFAWFGNYFGNAAAVLYQREVRMDQLTIVYIDPDKTRLPALMATTNPLASRLAGMARQPVRLFLGESGGVYEIFCMRPDGGARSLMFSRDQLDRIADEQLYQCLS